MSESEPAAIVRHANPRLPMEVEAVVAVVVAQRTTKAVDPKALDAHHLQGEQVQHADVQGQDRGERGQAQVRPYRLHVHVGPVVKPSSVRHNVDNQAGKEGHASGTVRRQEV